MFCFVNAKITRRVTIFKSKNSSSTSIWRQVVNWSLLSSYFLYLYFWKYGGIFTVPIFVPYSVVFRAQKHYWLFYGNTMVSLIVVIQKSLKYLKKNWIAKKLFENNKLIHRIGRGCSDGFRETTAILKRIFVNALCCIDYRILHWDLKTTTIQYTSLIQILQFLKQFRFNLKTGRSSLGKA